MLGKDWSKNKTLINVLVLKQIKEVNKVYRNKYFDMQKKIVILQYKNNMASSVHLKRYYVPGTKYRKHHMVRDKAVEIDTDQQSSLRILDFVLRQLGLKDVESSIMNNCGSFEIDLSLKCSILSLQMKKERN